MLKVNKHFHKNSTSQKRHPFAYNEPLYPFGQCMECGERRYASSEYYAQMRLEGFRTRLMSVVSIFVLKGLRLVRTF